jgi:hypothetical protein
MNKYRIYKDYQNQWKAETTILLHEEKRLELKISSYKSRKELVTNASVSVRSEDGMSTTHALFSDFNKLIQRETCSRVTEKVLESFHNQIDVANVIKQAKEFYKL